MRNALVVRAGSAAADGGTVTVEAQAERPAAVPLADEPSREPSPLLG